MSSTSHTYGPTCHLAQSTPKSTSNGEDDIPDLVAQFFYSSPLPIDDPLSAAPAPTGSETTKHPPRPFSAYDNSVLEESWLGLASEKDRKNHFKGKPPKWANKDEAERRSTILERLSSKESKKRQKKEKVKHDPGDKKEEAGLIQAPEQSSEQGVAAEPKKTTKALKRGKKSETENPESKKCCTNGDCGDPSCCSPGKTESTKKGTTHGREKSKGHDKEKFRERAPGKEKSHDISKISPTASSLEQHDGSHDIKQKEKEDVADDLNSSKEHKAASKHAQSKGHKEEEVDPAHAHTRGHQEYEQHQLHDKALQAGENAEAGPSRPLLSGPAGITGSPFARAPSRRSSPLSQAYEPASLESESQAAHCDDFDEDEAHMRETSEEFMQVFECKAHRHFKEKDEIEVPVGISRLHLVKLPALQMKPIYWSPVHDGAVVTRGTWFYKDTMLPVEPAVANQLEIGYRELRPWSQTWKDELNSAIDVGAFGEEKIVHQLWPKDDDAREQKKPDRPDTAKSQTESLLSTDPYCAAKCFQGEAAAVGTLEEDNPSDETTIVKRYPHSQVIYKDGANAFILKPSLAPSAYYGRRPLPKIMRGHTVGVHVVRGFDWKAWDKLHPSKKSATTIQAEDNCPVAETADSAKNMTCPACRTHQERPKVTDLVLVIHGIGQKLSERVESFHFTHAINTFRRSVNVELGNGAVQPVLRKDLGGIMVLPVNWRSNLSFEDGGPKKGNDKDKKDSTVDDFTLKDITPDTIPAVRSLISDVMLDIPFYMSHHKPKMIEALIMEANRVYTLWTKNNPGFEKSGRVHLIAHSLGSVMALDVLSKQPTATPKPHLGKKINTKHFDFDTTNLFFVGSPVGFFLLLEKGNLTPRQGRSKPDADLDDVNNGNGVTAEVGTFGSLAVDNIYNIMHYNDPIAYRINATVDSLYAASLQPAQVPSATTGWFEAFSKAIKSVTPGVSAPTDLAVGQLAKPATIQRLPSQLEMEVHDFTREEIAEKKFYLLNDNGQVDWFLSSGGGPLEIQYLNMLGAHSSYWGSADFIRMLVTEVGREPGKKNTLPNLRALKSGQHKRK